MTDATDPAEIQIIGITIDDWRFDAAPGRHRARVQFRYDLSARNEIGFTDCIGQSDLPADAAHDAVRDALIANAMGQLRRMPEIWLGEANLTLCTATENVKLPV